MDKKLFLELYNDQNKQIEYFSTGKISYAEYQQINYKRSKDFFMPKLLQHMIHGEWGEFCNLALAVYEIMPEAFEFFDEVPDNMKYDFAISAYIHHGDSIPAVRKAVRQARKYGKPDLPEKIKSAETITIFRAGEEPIEKAKYRISWTADKSIAEFFLNEYIYRHASHLYQGKIKTADIIAYCDDRNEKEIMQYRKVFDVEEITL